MFDLINVPAQYACDTPFVRLYGDFCGYPLSGFETIKWFGGGLFYTVGELIKGNFATQIPELIVLICILIIVLPFFGTLLLIGNQNSRRLQTINMIVWGLAGLLASTMVISQTREIQSVQFIYLLWGLVLYILLAIGAIIFEILMWRLNIKPGMGI